MALPHRAVSQLCQRLEGEPQPLRQSGPGDDLARQVKRRSGSTSEETNEFAGENAIQLGKVTDHGFNSLTPRRGTCRCDLPPAWNENPLAFLVWGHNDEHLDSLADRSVPIANVGAPAAFVLEVVAGMVSGQIACTPLRVSNHHHAMP